MALTLPGNLASRRVLEKLGFALEGQVHTFGLEALCHRISRHAFLVRPSDGLPPPTSGGP